MALSKRLRYEILRRDNHTCRYCGASAPDVKLTVDHVVPVALGGSDDPTNLVTACPDCNAGKAASNPDAALVADVAQDAIRWAAAKQLAVEQAAREHIGRLCDIETVVDYFEEEFRAVYGQVPPMPMDARQAIGRWLDYGLIRFMASLVDATVAKSQTVPWDKLWNYFAGCCWTQLRELDDRAEALIASGVV